MSDTAHLLALETRDGLPQDLRFLLEKYPREVWLDHRNLGDMASFWLQRHNMFRELGGMLNDANDQFRNNKIEAPQFTAFAVPRLQFFLQQLNAHHQIEDHHYFPVFSAAEARLAPGFELLESDHHVLHENIVKVVETANALLGDMQQNGDLKGSLPRYSESAHKLIASMLSHLRDEEDLIVPLILDRGERELGVAH